MEKAGAGQAPRGSGAGPACEEAALNDGALRELEALLREAGGSGGVDPRALEIVSGLRGLIEGIGSRWMGVSGTDGFYMYQVTRNVELVLIQMERGLREHRDASGRPGIASDSLVMLPVMDRALGIARSERADPALVEHAKGVSREMVDRSRDVGLNTPREEIYAEIDWDEWNREIPLLMKILES